MIVVSEASFAGSLAVKDRDVNGKVDGSGFPASKEMTPGCFSSGKRPRTIGQHDQLFFH